jgi:hypothetical protein
MGRKAHAIVGFSSKPLHVLHNRKSSGSGGMNMNKVTCRIAVIACATALVSCASRGHADSTATAAAKPAVVPAAVAAAYGSSTGTVPAAKSTQVEPTPLHHENSLYGYNRVVMDNKEKYCRREILTGTHFKQSVCITRDEVIAQHTSGENFFRQFGPGRNLPPGGK